MSKTIDARGLSCPVPVLMAADRLGFGDDELGKKLVISFIKTLKEMGDELRRLVLVNNGVKLTIETSPVREDLVGFLQKSKKAKIS